MRVSEHTTTIDGVPVFYRSALPPGPGPAVPALYLHDALTSSDDFVGFLERTGGIAPDLIGFGRSGKGGHLDYSPQGLTDFARRFLTHVGVERTDLAGHGWGGAVALLLALREPRLVERLVLLNPVPLLDGFTWPTPVRLWRRPILGELIMGSTPRWLLTRGLRRSSVRPEAWSADRLTAAWEQFDHGTQRALLRLYRVAAEERLAELGGELGTMSAPTLIVWGDEDPWFEANLADRYGDRLPQARIEHVGGAGHWPWLDQPEVIDRVTEFLSRP